MPCMDLHLPLILTSSSVAPQSSEWFAPPDLSACGVMRGMLAASQRAVSSLRKLSVVMGLGEVKEGRTGDEGRRGIPAERYTCHS